jgi:hypothetical protein
MQDYIWIRFEVWRQRRRAKYLSRYTNVAVTTHIGGVQVGRYIRGKERKNAS